MSILNPNSCGSLLPVFDVSFGDVSLYVCSYYFCSVWVAEWLPVWERAAHSVDRMFSFVILVIPHFDFEGRILVLIAPVPGYCLLVTFIMRKTVSPHFLRYF